jgi:hypothetical protein
VKTRIMIVNVRFAYVHHHYIGRYHSEFGKSALANPFKIGVDGDRNEVIEKYRRWLWNECQLKGKAYEELMELVQQYKKGEVIILGCWCTPLKCHGEVIRRAIEFFAKDQKQKGGE